MEENIVQITLVRAFTIDKFNAMMNKVENNRHRNGMLKRSLYFVG